jgi:hypothetical protein
VSNTYPYGVKPPELWHTADEQLSGYVRDSTGKVKKASDIEERSVRAIVKLKEWNYIFRQRLAPAAIGGWMEKKFLNLPGEVEIDILASRATLVFPILVDGQIGHFMYSWQHTIDDEKVAKIDEIGSRFGWQPAVRVKYDKLFTQSAADQYYRNLLR